jgi:uncharacterized membrane protein YkoI
MRFIILAATLVVGLSFGNAWALFETDKKLSESATVTLENAVKTAVTSVPGKAVEVNMGKDDGRVVYKVEIIESGTGKSRHVYVDAKDGTIVQKK